MDTSSIVQNMIRAAKLDKEFYAAIEKDESKNSEARTVVIIAAIASAIGNGIGGLFSGGLVTGLMAMIFGLLLVLAGYYIWAYLTHFIATKFFGGEGDVGEVLRAYGYAYSPQVLTIFALIPCLGWTIAFAAGIWSVIAGIFAIRESMNFDTGKAILTVVIAWAIMMVIFMIIGMAIGVGGIGLAVLNS